MSLKRVAAVTGGSSGIGLAIVQRLQVFPFSHNPFCKKIALLFCLRFCALADRNSTSHKSSRSVWATLPSAGTFKRPPIPPFLM
jgi:hypothetical protein